MKRSKLLLVIAVMALLSVLFVACDGKAQDESHQHAYGAWKITDEPTDDATGTATRQCSSGDDVQTLTIAKLSDASVWTVKTNQDPTHESDGYAVYTSEYGTVTVVIPKGTHSYGTWQLMTAPTDTETGTAIRTCACGHYETKTIAALSDASVWSVTPSQDPTHESKGFAVYTSEYGTVTVEIAKGEHSYGAWQITKAPTDTETGTAIRTCSCGHFESVTVAALSDTTVWTKDEENSVAATHFAAGKNIYTSAYGTVEVAIPQGVHEYGVVAHDNGDGTHYFVCTDAACGDKKYAGCVYDKKNTDNKYLVSPQSCGKAATYVYSCVCGAQDPDTTHTFTSGEEGKHDYQFVEVISEPTCTEKGSVKLVCTLCGDEKIQETAALGHDFVGECIPYVHNYGMGESEEEASYDGSEYHVVKCTRCDAVDSANKEAHDFGEPEYELVKYTEGYHFVRVTTVCDKCGYVNKNDDAFNGYVEQTEFWTFVESKDADYANDGYVKYVYNSTGVEYTIKTEDKLVAPYCDKTYTVFEVSVRDGAYGTNSKYNWNHTVTFDKDGVGTGTGFTVKGTNTITIIDGTGKIEYKVVDGEKTSVYDGYIDIDSGIIFRTKAGSYDSLLMLVPTDFAVNYSSLEGSNWYNAMAIAYSADCSLGETHDFTVAVYDEVVYFGARFVDAEGNPIAAEDCYNADYVKFVKADGTKIVSFARNAEGAFVETDGKEGVYAAESHNVKLDGVGGVTIDGAETGTYTISESAEYGYDVYTFTDGKATAYYRLTLGEEFTCTLVKPMATLTFTSEYGTADNMSVNVNIECALPVIADREAFVLKGWSLAGSEEVYRTFVPTGDSYAFTAVWGAKCAVTVSGLLEDDESTYGSFYLAAGDSFVSALPAYTADTINEGYYFAGWYFDSNGNGVIDEEDEAIDPGTVVVDGQTSATVIGEWLWAGNVTFAAQSGYTFVYDYENGYWKSNNQGVDNSTAVLEFAVSTGKAVVSFEYYCESEAETKWDYMTIWYGPTWTSVNAGGKACDWNWKTLTTTLTYTDGDSNQKIRISYQKDGGGKGGSDTAYIRNLRINGVLVTAQSSLNTELAGTYTASDSTQVIVGMGGALQIGENFYGYTVLDENTISATIEGTYKEITLDKSAGTCEIVVPQVNVTYNYMGHGENTTTAVNKFSTQTLSTDVPTAEGYIFRGWYTSDAFTTAASATFTASEDVTFYAKWDAAVTLTFDYNGQGTAAVVVSDKYVGDNVSGIPEVTETFGTKVFAGWFLYDSETDTWGEEASTSTVLTGNTTYYAKWVEPSVFAGTYTMLKVDSSSFNFYNSDSAKLTLDELGKGVVTAYNGFSNKDTIAIVFAEGSTTEVEITVSGVKWYGAYDAASGIIICSSSSSDKLGYSTVVMMVPYNSGYVKADFTYGYWTDTFKYRAIQFTDRNVADTTRSIFIADATTFYTNAEFKAYDGSAIAANNCSTSVNLFVYSNETLVKEFAYNGSQLVSTIDSYKGVYTNGTASLFLNGAGIATMGEKSGTYAPTAGNANVLDVYLANNTEYYEVTVDVEAKTFTATQPTVNVTYNYNGHGGTDNTTTTLKNVAYTVTPTSLTEEGFIFRGWYTDEALTTKASSTYTPSADLVFYAKWDAAVTLTFDYNGQGTAAVVVPDKYVGDKVSGIPTVTVTKGEQVFAGWFSLNGTETGEWGEEASTSTVLTGNTTYYAKWITPVKSYGTYKGFEVWSAASGKNASSMSTTVLTMNANGTYTGIRSISGTLSDEDALVENGAINLTRYAYVTNAFGGIVILGYSSNATSVGDDFYIGFKNSANITSVDYSAVSLSGIYTAWLTVSYTEGSTAKTIGILVYNNVIYANVTWKSNGSDVEAKKCASTDKLVIYNSEGQPMLVKDGNTIAGNDGKAGSYESGSAYGTIVLDGFGTLTIGEDSTSYTLDGNVVSFTLNNAMRKVTLGDGIYTKTLDGFEGTYTLPDGTTTIVLDGYGNADATKTYVVEGTTITVYDGETSTAYGIDVANKLFLGKSKFAGKTFTKSSTHYVTFDDGVNISGKMLCGYSSWYVMFDNGVLEGNTLTVTITEQVGTGATVGSTIVFNVSGDTLEIVSGSFPHVDTAVGYTYTCSGFSL